ncbi:MAG: flavin reductase, partial [Methylobacter sp.]
MRPINRERGLSSNQTRLYSVYHETRGADMPKESFPLSRVYGLLEPGPVVLVSTAREGRANIMTMSWHTMLEFEPPL